MPFLNSIFSIKGYLLLGLLYLTLATYAIDLQAQTATAPSSGSGTVGDPYQIATLNNLYWIYASTTRWNDHYIQTANIDASGTSSWNGGTGWMPIGNSTSAKFTGSYDGDGFTISGLTINRGSSDRQGLFGNISNATLANITLVNVDVVGDQQLGGIVGLSENSVVTNCHITGGSSISGHNKLGGICGEFIHAGGSTIKDCSSDATVDGYAILGGIIGRSDGAITFINCENTGNVTASGSSTASDKAGGILGEGASDVTMKNCINSGSISGADYVGGIIGIATNNAHFSYCSNSGIVIGWRSFRGGIAGNVTDDGFFYRCANTAIAVQGLGSSSDWDYIGGIVGNVGDRANSGIIEECYSLANISGDRFIGGLAGYLNGVDVLNSYSHGNVSGVSYSAGIAGYLYNSPNVENSYSIGSISRSGSYYGGLTGRFGSATSSYWDRQTSGVTVSSAGTSKTTAEMHIQSTYVNWNFHTVWHLDACSTANGYPILRWQNVDFTQAHEPAIGEGTVGAPYEISNLNELYWIVTDRKNWDKHYIQTADIDVTTVPVVCGYGYTPIGDRQDPFSGSYDGQHFEIQNLSIDAQTEEFPDLGMFGVSSGTIQKVLLDNVDIKGGSRIGGLLGHQEDGLLTQNGVISGSIECFIAGGSSAGETGGLVGRAEKNVTQNYVKSGVSVTSVNGQNTGGFAGMFVPVATATMEDNYSMANLVVSGTVSSIPPGAFVGRHQTGGGTGTQTLRRNYATGAIAIGNGFIGSSSTGGSSANFFDYETTGQTSTDGSATPRTTAVMKTMSNYTAASWDFACETNNGTADIWGRNLTDNSGYPFLMWEGYIPACIIWVGSISTDWATAANWDSGEVPVQGAEVIFHSNAFRDLVLDQHRSVSDMDFNGSDKKVVLGDYNLTVSGEFRNANTLSYAQTSGLGLVIVTIPHDVTKLLPVGHGNLTPLDITNRTGSSDQFRIRVFDEVLSNGISGTKLVNGKGVDRTWIIEKQNPNGGSGVDLGFYWNVSALRGIGEGSWDGNGAALYHYDTSSSNWEVYMSNISFSSPSQRIHGTFNGGSLGKVTYTGYLGSFSPFTVQDVNSTLPVELYEFEGQVHDEGVLLKWSTLSEVNNEEFVLYRSADGKQWEEITRKEGQSYSSQKLDYAYLDRHAKPGLNYYTLEQRSNGEEPQRFGVIRVMLREGSEAKNTPRLMPNPWAAGEALMMQCPVAMEGEFKLVIYRADGTWKQSIDSSSLTAINEAKGLYALPSLNLKPGVYIILVQSKDKRFPIRFMVE